MIRTAETLTARRWSEADTVAFQGWFAEDPSLSTSVGSDHDLSGADVRAIVRDRIADDEAIAAIEADGELVGVVTIHPRISPTSGVVHISVAPHARGIGIAVARCALAHARERGFTRLVAPPAASIPAKVHQRWLTRAGFGIGYYGDWHA